MNVHSSFAPNPSGKPPLVADRGGLVMMLVHLWPYIWPSDRRDLKLRVLAAAVLLFLAKLATMVVPFTFKWATDALASQEFGSRATWIGWAVAALVLFTLA